MAGGKTFSQDLLERIRSGEINTASRKKRKISRFILLADVILVVFLLIYFTSGSNDDSYLTSSFQFGNNSVRFSAKRDQDKARWHFSLAFKNLGNYATTITFRESIALLSLQLDRNTIMEKSVGRGTTRLILEPGEIRTFVVSISCKDLDKLARNHRDSVVTHRRTLIRTARDYLPLSVKISLNNGTGLGTSLDIKHEVPEE